MGEYAKIMAFQPPEENDQEGWTPLDLIDFNASKNPDWVWARQAIRKSSNEAISFQDMTHSQLKHCVRNSAAWLKQTVASLSSEAPSPMALFMDSDASMICHIWALMSLGAPVVLLSNRLSPTGIRHLLHSTGAFDVIASPRLAGSVRKALIESTEQQIQIWSPMSLDLHHSMWSSGAREEPLQQESMRKQSQIILHSSGTTGLPKPVYHVGQSIMSWATGHEVSSENGPCLVTLPVFHAFGLMATHLSTNTGMPLVLPPSGVIPNASLVIDLIRSSGAKGMISVPATLEDLVALGEDRWREPLSKLEFIGFGGGVLKESVGETLSKAEINISNSYGASETGPLTATFVPSKDTDRRYMRLRSNLDAEFKPTNEYRGGRQLYSLTVRPVGLDGEFVMQDLILMNDKGEFTIIGRSDNLIVLANGEKFSPQTLESSLVGSPLIKEAIAFGQGQVEIGVIVQPSREVPDGHRDSFLKSVWSSVSKANISSDKHAQITSKNAIIVVPYNIELPRSAKGELLRKEVYELFQNEIEAFYLGQESAVSSSTLSIETLEQDIIDLVEQDLGEAAQYVSLNADSDIFLLGYDSLQALHLRRQILASFRTPNGRKLSNEEAPRDFIYQFPTARRMADALRNSQFSQVAGTESSLETLLEQYRIAPMRPALPESHVVLVTGASGGLGSNIVARLASLESIAAVICLNRGSIKAEGEAKQKKAMAAGEIEISPESWKKIKAMTGSTASEDLGLSTEETQFILDNVTHIIHAAWPMDFKRTLSSFGDAFQSLTNLIKLAQQLHQQRPHCKARLLFVSSISSAGAYPGKSGENMIPERPMPNLSYATGIGYGKAKLVCEKIIEQAARDLSGEVELICARVGQISGHTDSGVWNETEHFPALVKSSQTIGKLPRLNGVSSPSCVERPVC